MKNKEIKKHTHHIPIKIFRLYPTSSVLGKKRWPREVSKAVYIRGGCASVAETLTQQICDVQYVINKNKKSREALWKHSLLRSGATDVLGNRFYNPRTQQASEFPSYVGYFNLQALNKVDFCSRQFFTINCIVYFCSCPFQFYVNLFFFLFLVFTGFCSEAWSNVCSHMNRETDLLSFQEFLIPDIVC